MPAPEPAPLKRKRRSGERARRRAELAERRQLRTERTEARNQAVRDTLEPLAAGERPTVVTAAALIAAGLAISAPVAYLLGAEVSGERPAITSVIAPAALMGVLAWGLWTARYWASVAFQALLGILMIVATLGLVLATSPGRALGNVALLALAATLFWLMVKAMARIQMSNQVEDAAGPPPGRPGS